MARPTVVAWATCAVVTATGALGVGGLAAVKVRESISANPVPASVPVAAVAAVVGSASTSASGSASAQDGGQGAQDDQQSLPAAPKQAGGSITRAELDDFLKAHSDALKAKDRTAFLAAYDPSQTALVKQQGRLFDNLAKIPFDQATYAWFAQTGGETTFKDAHATVDVSFDHRISGVDLHPVEERYRWTVARTGPDGALAITSVAGSPAEGDSWRKTFNYPAPWDVVPQLTVIVRPHVVIMADGTSSALARDQASTAEASAEYDLSQWSGGSGAAPGFAVFLSSDRKLFDSLYTGNTDDRADEAGTAMGLTGPDSQTSYAGSRIDIDTSYSSGYFNGGGTDSTIIFRHEMAHALVMPYDDWSGPYSGSRQDDTWVIEGFAEWTAESDKSPTRTNFGPVLSDWLSNHSYPKTLPTSADIYASDAVSSSAHYQLAHLAMRYMAKTYGVAKADAFVMYVYQHDSGTTAVDDAMSSVLGTTTAQFTQGWAAYVRSNA